jgi:hypothetical protein
MIPALTWLFESEPSPAAGPIPSGHLSLLDMINFSLHNFSWAMRFLSQELLQAREHLETDPDTLLSKEEMDRLANNFRYIRPIVESMGLRSAMHRVNRVHGALYQGRGYPSYATVERELTTLGQAIEDDLKNEHFYHYPADKAEAIRSVHRAWDLTIKSFPSAGTEIVDAVDCYAVGHNTASVFHLMRVAEYGLRALARERGVTFPKHPLEWADWQNILEQTEAKAKDATKGMPRGPAKDAALAFYSGAIGQFHAFKDTYRNVTMHVQRRYDELDALRATNQVRDFMNGLSVRIGEKTRGPIKRWP